jgi:hypothetical protein
MYPALMSDFPEFDLPMGMHGLSSEYVAIHLSYCIHLPSYFILAMKTSELLHDDD